MIDNPPPLTIHRGWKRPDPALVARFAGAQTSHIVDAMEGRGMLDWRIKPLDANCAAFAAPALTAYAYPADTLAMFGALHEAQAGDAIIVGCDAFTPTALIGDIITGMMHNKGVVAFVTDGLARDSAGIRAIGMPVFAAGVVSNSGAMTGPGVVGAPVMVGGVHVRPGDILVGDVDGVVVVPADRAEQVLATLERVRAAETALIARVCEGLTMSDGALQLIRMARIVEA
jgi:4-hydroxy-4-methyl-2-oxoglutarate aldolase